MLVLSIKHLPDALPAAPIRIVAGPDATCTGLHAPFWFKVGVILRQPGGSSSAARRDVRAVAGCLRRPTCPGSGKISALSKPSWLRSLMIMRDELGGGFPQPPRRTRSSAPDTLPWSCVQTV